MTLLLRSCLVILFDRFIATGSTSKFVIDLATLSNSCFLSPKIIHINSFFALRHVFKVVSLLIAKDIGIELLLPLFESVDFTTTCVDWFCHATLRLPVCICTEASLIACTVIINWSLFFIATSEHARLELLVLFILSIEARIGIHTLLQR